MTRRSFGLLAVGALVTSLLLGAYGADPAIGAPPVESPPSTATSSSSTPSTAVPASHPAEDVTEKDFDAVNFPTTPKVDNRWYPLTPGTQYVLEGSANRGKGRLPHQEVFTVTDLVKVINGVPTIVLWDVDTNEGELQESELAFQAQDNDGNVWLLGKYPEEYEDGKFKAAESTWFAGLEGAKPGVLMRANPRTGTSSYLQGLAPKIEFQDHAKVSKSGLRTCIPLQCYDDVLLIDEWNPLKPETGRRLKYYASGVGNVRVGAIGDPEAEELVLVKVANLNPKDLAKARAEALKLEQHAYQVSPELYGRTPPAVATESGSPSSNNTDHTDLSDVGLAWVPFGPDDPKSPIPGPWPAYNAFAANRDCAGLQSQAEAFNDLGNAMVALCLAAVEGRQDQWEVVAKAFAAGQGSSNGCLNDKVKNLVKSALEWHQRHPGQKPVLRFPQVAGPNGERKTDCGKKETEPTETEPTETEPTETEPTETEPTETEPTQTPPTETPG
jgi:hypothetical protein